MTFVQKSYVRKTFGSLQFLYNFSGVSSKFNTLFLKLYNVSTSNLKCLYKTKWNCHTDIIISVFISYYTIINNLEYISDNEINSRSKAKSLFNNIQNFDLLYL